MDAVIERLRGTNPDAVAEAGRGADWSEIKKHDKIAFVLGSWLFLDFGVLSRCRRCMVYSRGSVSPSSLIAGRETAFLTKARRTQSRHKEICLRDCFISIPKAVRTARHWQAGQEFAFIPKGESVLLVPIPKTEDLIPASLVIDPLGALPP
jgi:hypothetical protein